MLTKSVKIDQSGGIPDPGIPERPLVKFPTGVLSLPLAALFFIFDIITFLQKNIGYAGSAVCNPQFSNTH